MSDNIPIEIVAEIMKRLPIRSLIQFRSVSKPWKHLIATSDFIVRYSAQQQRLQYIGQQQHLLVRYDDDSYRYDKEHYFSVVDDATFPDQKVSLTPPLLVNMLHFHRIIGCSHGLLCVYGFNRDGTNMAVIWNLSVRKAVAVVVPNFASGKYTSVLGFGVCGENSDPKIVKLTYVSRNEDMESVSSIPFQVEAFTLSTGVWRSPYSTNLPSKYVQFDCLQKVVVDGVLCWLASDRVDNMNGDFDAFNLIISFDMETEEFKEISLPEDLAFEGYQDDKYVSKLRNSLVVLERDDDGMIVWMMEGGVQKTFTKLYTIYTPAETKPTVLEFRKSGEIVIDYGYRSG